jgi:hypothetical protein
MKLRFRFSLRTLLLMMLLIGIGVGFYARWMQQAEKQRAAVAAINQVDGFALYDYQLDADGKLVTERIIFAELPGPDWLCEWFGVDCFADVVSVNLFARQRSSRSGTLIGLDPAQPELAKSLAEQLHNLPKLKTLQLAGRQFTDGWLQHLRGLTSLRELVLLDTGVSDEAVDRLQRELPNCQIYHGPWRSLMESQDQQAID